MRQLLLTEYFAPHAGGTAVYYNEVWRRLRGMKVIVVARTHPGAPAFDCKQPFMIMRTPFSRIPKVRMVVEFGVQLLAGLRLTERHGVSIVHGGQVYPLGLAAFAIHLVKRIPYVLYVNAANVAVSAGLMASRGKLDIFFGLITPHGLLELTAVFLAGAVGMRLGWKVVDPGPRRRVEVLAE